MRDAIRKKLYSQTGASLLIALLYFLVAMTVGAVVLTAAATNAGRLARDRKEQQDHLAVSSAAMLVKEDLCGTTFTVGYTKEITKTTVTWTDEETGVPHTGVTVSRPSYDPIAPTLSGSGGLGAGELLQGGPAADLGTLYFSTVPIPSLHQDRPADMKYSLKIAAEGLPDVLGVMEVDQTDDARYTITVKLYTRTEDGAPAANAMTLLFAHTVNDTEAATRGYAGDTETITTTYTTTVAWGAPTIEKGAAA